MHYNQTPINGNTLSEDALNLYAPSTVFKGKECRGKIWLFIIFFLYTAFETTSAAVPTLVYENSIAISSKSLINFSKHFVILAVFYCHLTA